MVKLNEDPKVVVSSNPPTFFDMTQLGILMKQQQEENHKEMMKQQETLITAIKDVRNLVIHQQEDRDHLAQEKVAKREQQRIDSDRERSGKRRDVDSEREQKRDSRRLNSDIAEITNYLDFNAYPGFSSGAQVNVIKKNKSNQLSSIVQGSSEPCDNFTFGVDKLQTASDAIKIMHDLMQNFGDSQWVFRITSSGNRISVSKLAKIDNHTQVKELNNKITCTNISDSASRADHDQIDQLLIMDSVLGIGVQLTMKFGPPRKLRLPRVNCYFSPSDLLEVWNEVDCSTNGIMIYTKAFLKTSFGRNLLLRYMVDSVIKN